jgi:hypothetical protein
MEEKTFMEACLWSAMREKLEVEDNISSYTILIG